MKIAFTTDLPKEGEGVEEKGIVEKVQSDKVPCRKGDVVVRVSPDFYRPTDVVNLLGDPSKAKQELGWNPQSTSFEQLVELMVKHDMKKVAADDAAAEIRKVNLAEYLEKGVDK